MLWVVLLAVIVPAFAATEDDWPRTVQCVRNPNGSVYIGQMRDEQFDGYGALYLADGVRHAGVFANNDLSAAGRDDTSANLRLYVNITPETIRITKVDNEGISNGVGAYLISPGAYYAGELKDGAFTDRAYTPNRPMIFGIRAVLWRANAMEKRLYITKEAPIIEPMRTTKS